jgi:hypothetical protein
MKSSTLQRSELLSERRVGAVTFALVKCLVLLNLFDTVATLLMLSPSLEANPLASAVLAKSPLLFVLCKLFLVWILSALLAITESVRAIALLVGLYFGVCILHVVLAVTWVVSQF